MKEVTGFFTLIGVLPIAVALVIFLALRWLVKKDKDIRVQDED